MLDTKTTVTDMKNAFNELISLDKVKETISNLEDIPIESSNTKKQKEQRLKKKRTEHPRTIG